MKINEIIELEDVIPEFVLVYSDKFGSSAVATFKYGWVTKAALKAVQSEDSQKEFVKNWSIGSIIKEG